MNKNIVLAAAILAIAGCANTKAPPHAAAEAVTHSTLKAATRRSIAQHELFRRSRIIPTNAQTVQFCYEILADNSR